VYMEGDQSRSGSIIFGAPVAAGLPESAGGICFGLKFGTLEAARSSLEQRSSVGMGGPRRPSFDLLGHGSSWLGKRWDFLG
jgi:hypothetical protein